MNQQNEQWSAKELRLLAELYPDVKNEDITLFIDRSKSAIEHKANRRGLRKSEKFLNSRKSGRFTTKVSIWNRIRNFLRMNAAC
jgi:hypothetical protein